MLVSFIEVYAQWEEDVRLTENSSKSELSGCSAWNIAAAGDNVYVAWYDQRNGVWDIFFKYSTDGGLTWSEDTCLTDHSAGSDYPSVAAEGSDVHIVWEKKLNGNYEIFYKHSSNGGQSWEDEIRLTNDPGKSYQPSLAVSGSDVHVVWYEDRDGQWEIYYKRSTDKGLTWSEDVRLTDNPADAYFPSVAASGQNVNIVWSDYRETDEEVYSMTSTDGGLTWGSAKRLTTSDGYSDYPSVAASGQLVHAAWYDNRDGSEFEIYYKRSTDGGLNWDDDVRLTNDINASDYANIAADSNCVHVVWEDDRTGAYEIYYKRSTDGGVSWGEDTRLTNNASSAIPCVAASASSVHVVFNDSRDGGSGEIYYKRDPTGNITEVEDIPAERRQVRIFPNPAAGFIFIESEESLTGKIEIYSVKGTKVLESKCTGKIDVSKLNDGIYYLVANFGSDKTVKRFCISR